MDRDAMDAWVQVAKEQTARAERAEAALAKTLDALAAGSALRERFAQRATSAEAESRLLRDELRALADAVEAYSLDESTPGTPALQVPDVAEHAARQALYDSAPTITGGTDGQS